MDKLELIDHKYQTNGNVRDKNYEGKFLFNMKGFLSFGKYCPQMYFMSARLLKDKIDGFHVTQFQLDYFLNTTHFSHKSW